MAVLALLALLLLATGADLWSVWRGEASLGHAPMVPAIVLFLLWQRRAALREWSGASPWGAALLGLSVLLYAAADRADVEFMKPLSLIGITFGLCWFLGGGSNLGSAAGALGFLLFTIPWPTTLVGRLQLPLQLASSAYAAMFAGVLGIPVHRDGVTLSVVPDPARPPTYEILVAQECSGLTSLIVLVALGYLIAYFTPVHWAKRALLFLITIPLALVMNAVRLTFILITGARHGAAVAQWVHDHEQPVLVFFCTLGLMGVRALMLRGSSPATAPSAEGEAQTGSADLAKEREEHRGDPAKAAGGPKGLAGVSGCRSRSRSLRWRWAAPSPVARTTERARSRISWSICLCLTVAGTQERPPLSADERAMLEPDAELLRRYRSAGGASVEIAVIAGRRKKTVHTPEYCLLGGGWDIVAARRIHECSRPPGAGDPVAAGSRRRTHGSDLFLHRRRIEYAQSAAVSGGADRQTARGGHAPLGAMVRNRSSGDNPEDAQRLSDDFARATLPAVFAALVHAAK